MSNKKHRGSHGRRAETRAAAHSHTAAVPGKPCRVYLRNPLHIWATLGALAATVAVLVFFEQLGWWDTVIGSVLSVLIGAFGCMCLYDVALLLTACITFGDGMVNAGKDAQGAPMVFHAASVVRLEVRDKTADGGDKPLPHDLPVYKNAELCFIMESGRVNRRPVTRLTQKQYQKVKAALAAEQKLNAKP